MELFHPEIQAQVGDYVLSHGVELEVCSARYNLFDWAKVRFTPEFQPKLTLTPRARAHISLGYDGALEEVFSGYVARPYSGDTADEVLLKDAMLRLEDTLVSGTFLDTTPQEMISYFLNQAGTTDAVLDGQTYPERRRVVVPELNVIQAIQEVHTQWGINPAFFFSKDTFYWGAEPQQEDVYRFQYGVNILSLARKDGLWVLKTVSAPFVRHSHMIQVEHPLCSGSFRVSKVVFTTEESGFIRTYLYF